MASIIVDDRDPSIIYSTGVWWYGGVYPEYDNTTRGSQTAGTPAQIQFLFRGTRIAVYGTISEAALNNSIPPISTYNLDELPTSTYSAVNTQDTPLYKQQFYDSGVIADGQHTLVINPDTDQLSTMWFDYLEYMPSSASSTANPSPSQASSMASSLVSTTTTSIPSASSIPTPPSTTSTNNNLDSKSSVPVASIVGGVVGGVVFLVVAALVLFFVRRRKNESPSPVLPSPLVAMRERDSHVTPFLPAPAHYPQSKPTTTSIQYSQPTVAPSSRPPSTRTGPPTTTSPPTTEIRFHEDAGLRLDGGRNQVIDIPPEYQEYSD